MDNARKDSDALAEEIHECKTFIATIQANTWRKLCSLQNNKDFLQLHKDHIRSNRLSRIAEINYILDLIDEVEAVKSDEIIKEINELYTAKTGLEQKCTHFRKKAQQLETLLREAEEENEKLGVELKGRDNSGENAIKNSISATQFERQEEFIQKLKIDLENTRRDKEYWKFYENGQNIVNNDIRE
ncbi:hypothetical protein PSTG_18485 [Puccinia striiformis f. sp. tritici PST-78]|uniref:Uncharacterized protein n=1 Tax=Puccinia striiformis f. sp. tritici PST-78 TaxID=1165861 RepID=A0A0L0UMC8_9BASI|nr:hypothetical protein PSTG_18485 [Puccinia striiformis f. sp. tritici PST-78]